MTGTISRNLTGSQLHELGKSRIYLHQYSIPKKIAFIPLFYILALRKKWILRIARCIKGCPDVFFYFTNEKTHQSGRDRVFSGSVSEWHKGASVWSTFPNHGHPTSSPTDQQQELLGLLGSRLPQGPAEGATETTVHAVSVFSFFRTQK